MSYTDILFAFGFLPLYIIVTFMCAEVSKKNLASLILSVCFIVWSRPIYCAAAVLDLIVVYAAGRIIEKRNLPAVKAAVCAVVFLSVTPAVFALSAENTLRGAVLSFGFILFAFRSMLYLDEAKSGAEKNFINLSLYLISFEFMSVSPVLKYSEFKTLLKDRRTNLAMLSSGLLRFSGGLAAVTVLGFSLERIRQAALFSETVPFVNAIAGPAAAAVELYAAVLGYLAMSEGLCLISGYRIEMSDGCFLPRALAKDHIGCVYPSLKARLEEVIGGASQTCLAAAAVILCLVTGAALGLGAGTAAFLGLILTAVVLQNFFESGKSYISAAFTVLMFAAGFIFFSCGSLEGLIKWSYGFLPGKYPYEIGFDFHGEFSRSWIWAAAAVLYISPLRSIAEAKKRELMAASGEIYGALRISDAVISAALLVLSAIAMVSAA